MSEITTEIPKPLASIQGRPLLWHIMNIYSRHGCQDFILALGYKGEKIKEYFVNYDWMNHDFIRDGSSGKIKLLQEPENWKITFVDTGLETMTGGRLQRLKHLIGDDTFMLTYGDGLADIDITKLLQFHRAQNKIATVTGVYTKSTFGLLQVRDSIALSFEEKAQLKNLINGGFFVLNNQIFDYLSGEDSCVFEEAPLKNLAGHGELAVFLHSGFWIAVDTHKDLMAAEKALNNEALSTKGVNDDQQA
jgi:glucose-1-phosphate cytidylyltransferase